MASQDEYQQQQFFEENYDFWDDLPDSYIHTESLSIPQIIERYPQMSDFQIEQLYKLANT